MKRNRIYAISLIIVIGLSTLSCSEDENINISRIDKIEDGNLNTDNGDGNEGGSGGNNSPM